MRSWSYGAYAAAILGAFGLVEACVGDAPAGEQTAGDAAADTAAPTDAGGLDAVADASSDAGPEVPACDPSKPFGTPILAMTDPANAVLEGRLSADELTMYFSNGSATGSLYTVERSANYDPFSFASRQKLPGPVNAAGPTEHTPTVTPDGLNLFFESRSADAGIIIKHATRTSVLLDFGPPSNVTGITNVGTLTATPALNLDASVLYFAAADAGSYRLWSAPMTPVGAGTATPLVGAVNGLGERFPTPSADDLTVYFMRVVDGIKDNDIWVAERTSVGAPFTAHVVAELRTDAGESPSWLSPNGCSLYFTSDRSSDGGAYDGVPRIWKATRPK